MVSCAKKVIVTAILLFIWIVGTLSHIWVPFLYSYLLLLIGYNQRVLAYMQQIHECNPPKWTTNLWCPVPKRWEKLLYYCSFGKLVSCHTFGYPSYTCITYSYLATTSEALHICSFLSVIHPNELPIYGVLSRKGDSNCNTTVHLDSWHPATQLGTLPILVSPHPTWLQPKSPCIYADSWVESTQVNYQFMLSCAKKVIVTAILLFTWIVGNLPHIWVPFLYL